MQDSGKLHALVTVIKNRRLRKGTKVILLPKFDVPEDMVKDTVINYTVEGVIERSLDPSKNRFPYYVVKEIGEQATPDTIYGWYQAKQVLKKEEFKKLLKMIPTDERKTSTMKDTPKSMTEFVKTVGDANVEAGTIALKTKAGKVVMKNLIGLLSAKLGLSENVVGKFLDTALGHLVAANIILVAKTQFFDDAKYAELASSCLLLAAHNELADLMAFNPRTDLFKGLNTGAMKALLNTTKK